MNSSLLRFFILVLTILFFSHLISVSPSFDAFNQEWIDKHTRNNGMTGIAKFLAVSVFLLSIGLPRQLVAFMGGYAFGFAEGVIYSTLAATLSCATVMAVSRYFARPIIIQHFEMRVRKLDHFLVRSPFLKSVIIRLLPVGNNLLTNIFAGVSKIPRRSFILGSTIGYIPQMAVFALMGKGVLVNSELKIIISALLVGISSLLSAYLFKGYRRQHNDDKTLRSLTKSSKCSNESDELSH